MTATYKWTDVNKTEVALYENGTVRFIAASEVPAGEVILDSWTDEDQKQFEREQDIIKENAWRLEQIRLASDRIDQIRNDEMFGVRTYSKGYSSSDYNRYRVELVQYADEPEYPYNDRPTLRIGVNQ